MALGMGTSFHGGLIGKPWKKAHMPGAYVWKKALGLLSLPTGAPMGNLGKGVCLPGTLGIG